MIAALSTRFFASKAASTAHRATTAASSAQSGPQYPKGIKITPYAMYVKQNFKSEPNAKNGDLMKDLGAKWKELSVSEKDKYSSLSKEHNEKKLNDFLKLSTEEQEKIVNEEKEKKVERAHRRDLKKKREKRKAEGRPVQPPSAYALFIKEKVRGSGKDAKETMKKAIAEWKTFTDEQKTKFTEEASKLKEEYHTQLAKWEADKENK